MINRNVCRKVVRAAAVLSVAAALAMIGCAGEEPKQVAAVAPPPPPPSPPPKPLSTPVEQLMDELNIDRRIVLAEERAPDNDVDRKAVLVFFDALARGNSQSFKGMLPLADQMELNALVQSGAWKDTTSKITKVEVQTGKNSLNLKCALAVVEVGSGADMTFQPQLWYYNSEREEPVFEAAPTPPGILDKLSGDWIASWHEVLAAEFALAEKPDDDVTAPQVNLDTNESEKSSGGGAIGGGGGGGKKPGGTPRRDPKKTPKIPAPG